MAIIIIKLHIVINLNYVQPLCIGVILFMDDKFSGEIGNGHYYKIRERHLQWMTSKTKQKLDPNYMDSNQIPFIGILICLFINAYIFKMDGGWQSVHKYECYYDQSINDTMWLMLKSLWSCNIEWAVTIQKPASH